jgi:hypothetical protein
MTASPSLSFEAIAYQFRKRGIVITSLPGEYSVNYLGGKTDTAETRETLNEAIELAEAMARKVPAATARTAASYHPKRRLSMKPKAIIKRRIKAHNRRLRAWAIKVRRDAVTTTDA